MTWSLAKGTALVTGASSAIGVLYAHGLARRGYNLLLVARQAERLEDFAAWLRLHSGKSVVPLSADLTDQVDIAGIEDRLARDPGLTLVVNNADEGTNGAPSLARMGGVEAMLALNASPPARLAYAAAIAFSERRRGTVVNIVSATSTGTAQSRAGEGDKPFLVTLSETLDGELRGTGVRTQVVAPEPSASALWNLAGRAIDRLPRQVVLLAEEMVGQALTGLDAGEPVTRPMAPRFAGWDLREPAPAGSFAFR